MKRVAILALVSASLFAGAAPALADHHDEGLLPWLQLDDAARSGRGKANKARPGVSEANRHWGKHHEHGIHLEGGEFTSNSGASAYD